MTQTSWNPYDRLTSEQREQLAAYVRQLLYFNQRINLIAPDSEAHVDERHILHALALTYRAFPHGSSVVDWGTGGGLPALPLAICFPHITVHAVDAVGKKIQCVRAISRRLGVTNLYPWHGRAEAWLGKTPYSVSRATAPLMDLWAWHLHGRSSEQLVFEKDDWRPGLICLKGGDLKEEILALKWAYPGVHVETKSLQPLLQRPYFAGKCIVEVYEA